MCSFQQLITSFLKMHDNLFVNISSLHHRGYQKSFSPEHLLFPIPSPKLTSKRLSSVVQSKEEKSTQPPPFPGYYEILRLCCPNKQWNDGMEERIVEVTVTVTFEIDTWLFPYFLLLSFWKCPFWGLCTLCFPSTPKYNPTCFVEYLACKSRLGVNL